MAKVDGPPPRERLDLAMVRRGLVETRQKARALIMAGHVLVHDAPATKAGQAIAWDAPIRLKAQLQYVSRGGLKLETALDAFGVDPMGCAVLDVGISTGGFSDCLLQRGAAQVLGVDVGRGQTAWSLRTDPRVTLLEGTNFRLFDPKTLDTRADLVVVDVSFISLSLILPVVARCMVLGGICMPMVKPQFELGPGEVGKGGVVRDPAARDRAVEKVKALAAEVGFECLGVAPAGVPGPKGNQEYFLHLRLTSEA